MSTSSAVARSCCNKGKTKHSPGHFYRYRQSRSSQGVRLQNGSDIVNHRRVQMPTLGAHAMFGARERDSATYPCPSVTLRQLVFRRQFFCARTAAETWRAQPTLQTPSCTCSWRAEQDTAPRVSRRRDTPDLGHAAQWAPTAGPLRRSGHMGHSNTSRKLPLMNIRPTRDARRCHQ